MSFRGVAKMDPGMIPSGGARLRSSGLETNTGGGVERRGENEHETMSLVSYRHIGPERLVGS